MEGVIPVRGPIETTVKVDLGGQGSVDGVIPVWGPIETTVIVVLGG